MDITKSQNRLKKLAPSLLEADYRFLDEQLKMMEDAGADCVHLDVMDGVFVPNLSFGMKMIKSIRQSTRLEFDVHMMVREPHRFTRQMIEAGADTITIHYGACSNPEDTLISIKDTGVKAGIALQSGTLPDILNNKVLKLVDVVHLMTVEPGLEGQIFIPGSLQRISEVRKKLDRVNPLCDIEADGNITEKNIQRVIAAGANIIVIGKGLFAGNITDNIIKMKRLLYPPHT